MTKPRLLLHIGTHKTGTTSLQFTMSETRETLREAGFCYPDTTRGRFPGLNKHASLYGALDDGPDAFRREYALITEEFARSGAACLVLSEEGLSHPKYDLLAQMSRFAEDFEITIVCYLRRHDLMLEGLWNQYCREGLVAVHIADYLRQPGIYQRVKYLTLLEFWGALGRLRVRSYDMAIRGHGLFRDFSDVTGIPLPVDGDRRENRSPSMNCAAILAELNRRGISVPWQLIEFGIVPESRRTALGARLRREILARFADDTAVLAQRYGVEFPSDLPDEPEDPLAAPDWAKIRTLLSAVFPTDKNAKPDA
jgi:rhodanese-related sulfurtransferase